MKKIISILCALTVMTGFCACGNDTTKVEDSQSSIEEISEKNNTTNCVLDEEYEDDYVKFNYSSEWSEFSKGLNGPAFLISSEKDITIYYPKLEYENANNEWYIKKQEELFNKEKKEYEIITNQNGYEFFSYESDLNKICLFSNGKKVINITFTNYTDEDSEMFYQFLDTITIKGITPKNAEPLSEILAEPSTEAPTENPTELPTEKITEAPTESETISAVSTEKPTPEITQEAITLGMKNALSAAKDYLNVMSFSYSGLIEQLEYEKYSHEEAVYGADNCGADWNEQAAKSAQGYIDTMSFSRQELIDQLVYEGFTQEQAEYGVQAVGY